MFPFPANRITLIFFFMTRLDRKLLDRSLPVPVPVPVVPPIPDPIPSSEGLRSNATAFLLGGAPPPCLAAVVFEGPRPGGLWCVMILSGCKFALELFPGGLADLAAGGEAGVGAGATEARFKTEGRFFFCCFRSSQPCK